MKKFLSTSLTLIAACVISLTSVAQDKQPKGKNFDGKRPNYEMMVKHQSTQLIRELGLDNASAEKFTTTYTAYRNAMEEVMDKYMPRPNFKDGKKRDELPTDAEVEARIKNQFAMSRAMIDVREKYYNEFRKFLPPQQIEKVYREEMKGMQRFRNEKFRRDKAPAVKNGCDSTARQRFEKPANIKAKTGKGTPQRPGGPKK